MFLKRQEAIKTTTVIGIIRVAGGGLDNGEVVKLCESLQNKGTWKTQEKAQGANAIGITRGSEGGLVTGEEIKLNKS